MTTPFIPLVEPWVVPAQAERVQKQILSGFLGPGKATAEFAERLASLTQTRHCVPTVSGTAALSIAALAAGLKPGDEILVPAYGVISTINGFASVGLQPRLVEIDRQTACMDPAELASSFTSQTKAVCYVNFSGATGEQLLQVKRLCKQRGVLLIEDSACALGQTYQGRAAGSFGDVSISSFSVPKVLTTGQGGAVLTSDDGIAARAAALIDHGDLEWRKTNLNRGIGNNLRFNDVQAALGLAQLDDLPQRLTRKRAAHETLRSELGDSLFTITGSEAPLHNVVFARNPDALVQTLKANGIGAVRQYRTISQHPAYAHLATQAFPQSDFWTDHAVYLPFGLALTVEQAQRIGRLTKASGELIERSTVRRAA